MAKKFIGVYGGGSIEEDNLKTQWREDVITNLFYSTNPTNSYFVLLAYLQIQ
ncbi:hypothetical protein KIN20_026324 [Parelaphostrongylus tenuis]|uniref:Uncharacterized protein n=1 Tax=Parelaphostrongylus tenuis TaxID=148309 RepID=A0AAD5MWK0_PARTN|nr:hypothetical protein KIN20_026324 [Parelaphostrongylus tenuis]